MDGPAERSGARDTREGDHRLEVRIPRTWFGFCVGRHLEIIKRAPVFRGARSCVCAGVWPPLHAWICGWITGAVAADGLHGVDLKPVSVTDGEVAATGFHQLGEAWAPAIWGGRPNT